MTHRLHAGFFAVVAALSSGPASAVEPPAEPLEIGFEPQFVFDNHVIDNRWAIRYKREAVTRVAHAPVKHEANPVIAGDGGFGSVMRDEKTGLFRMWYQTWTSGDPQNNRPSQYAVAYAESEDGVHWERPNLGRYKWNGSKENNIIWTGMRGRASSPVLLDLPERDRRGFPFVFLYRDRDGIHLIGSADGLNWDRESDRRIVHLHSDTQNSIVYDPAGERYVMYCRAKHIYRAFGDTMLDTGASRRVAAMTSDHLWDEWTAAPQTILIPDELDERERFHFFYGMPTHYYGGVFWGFLWPFRMNDNIHTELAFSRDGLDFARLPERPKFLERGAEGAWDHGMAFGGFRWVEVGDEWWFYYAGWDGPHGTPERTPGIGLAKLRKEGFISLRGPRGGGVAATRLLRWPGGKLVINADASAGEIKVRVSDERRRPLPGFDYDDCRPLTADSTSHEVQWNDATLNDLKGQTIRLEFYLRDADLYTFRAQERDENVPAGRKGVGNR